MNTVRAPQGHRVARMALPLLACLALSACNKVPPVPVPDGIGPGVPCGSLAFGGFPKYAAITERQRGSKRPWPTYFVCREGEYALEFDPNMRLSRWTMSQVKPEHWQGASAPRRNDLRPDPLLSPDRRNVPSQWAEPYAFFQLQPADLVDNDEVAISHTYYTSTLLPIDKGALEASKRLNRSIRAWAAQRGTLVMVSGPIFEAGQPMAWVGTPLAKSKPDQEPRHRGLMAVPSYVFRVVLDPKTGQSTAFVLPNTSLPASQLAGRRVSLSQSEQWAGLTLFPRLSPDDAAKIRTPAAQNPAFWPLQPAQ